MKIEDLENNNSTLLIANSLNLAPLSKQDGGKSVLECKDNEMKELAYRENSVGNLPLERNSDNVGTICLALFLFFGGLIMFVSGIVIFTESEEYGGTGLMVVGAIMLLPGTYGMTKLTSGTLYKYLGYSRTNQQVSHLLSEFD